MNVVAYKRPSVIGLSLYVEGRQSFVESTNKWPLFWSEPLSNFFSLFLNITFLCYYIKFNNVKCVEIRNVQVALISALAWLPRLGSTLHVAEGTLSRPGMYIVVLLPLLPLFLF